MDDKSKCNIWEGILSLIVCTVIITAIYIVVCVLGMAVISCLCRPDAPEKNYVVTYTNDQGEPVTVETGEDIRVELSTGTYHNYLFFDTIREITQKEKQEMK